MEDWLEASMMTTHGELPVPEALIPFCQRDDVPVAR
jgi:hypothetical protein